MALLCQETEEALACPLCLSYGVELFGQLDYNSYAVACPHCCWEGTTDQLVEVV